MRRIIVLVVTTAFFTACKSQVRNAIQNDSISNQLSFLKSNISNSTNRIFDIHVVYGHNQIRNLKSQISVSAEEVIIESKTFIGQEKSRDTLFTKDKAEFIESIEDLEQKSDSTIFIAGNFQQIYFVSNGQLIEFPRTRAGMGLVYLLEARNN